MEESDCVIMLGAFLSDVLHGFMADYKRLDRRNSIMVTTQMARIGYRHYEDVYFEDFLNGMKNAAIKPRNNFVNPSERADIVPLTASQLAATLDTESMFTMLSLNAGNSASFVCDTGDALFGAIDIRTKDQQSFIADAYYLSMGFGVPASIGVMAANGGRKTIVLVGDGAFQMTGTELSTAIRFGFAPVVIVFNNDGYGTQRFIVDGTFNNILPWNYTKLIDVFGKGKAVKVQTNGEFQAALQEGLNATELFLIEAIIPKDNCSRALRAVGEGLKKARMG